jgi:hypothetical protein
MQRPSSINLTSGLMVLFIILGVYAAFRTPIVMPPNMNQTATPISPATLSMFVHVMALIGAVIAAVFVLFYWLGHEWARWAAMIYSGWIILMMFSFMKTWQLSHFNGTLMLSRVVVGIFLLWHLNTAPIKAWFKMPKTNAAIP